MQNAAPSSGNPKRTPILNQLDRYDKGKAIRIRRWQTSICGRMHSTVIAEEKHETENDRHTNGNKTKPGEQKQSGTAQGINRDKMQQTLQTQCKTCRQTARSARRHTRLSRTRGVRPTNQQRDQPEEPRQSNGSNPSDTDKGRRKAVAEALKTRMIESEDL